MSLLEEVCPWEQALGFQKPCYSQLSTPVDQMQALSSCCLPAAILPAMTVMNSNLS